MKKLPPVLLNEVEVLSLAVLALENGDVQNAIVILKTLIRAVTVYKEKDDGR